MQGLNGSISKSPLKGPWASSMYKWPVPQSPEGRTDRKVMQDPHEDTGLKKAHGESASPHLLPSQLPTLNESKALASSEGA